jgi:hypothetical protein
MGRKIPPLAAAAIFVFAALVVGRLVGRTTNFTETCWLALMIESVTQTMQALLKKWK